MSNKLHLRYVRLPNQILDLYDNLIYRSKKVVVGKAEITSSNSVVFNGEVVLARGFKIVYFELFGKWFNVCKIRNFQGKHTGYYCDITTPPKLLGDGGLELTDLFLDLWVSPDLQCKVLDEEELENALLKEWITRKLYDKAKQKLNHLVSTVTQGKFPPRYVRYLEEKLNI